MSSEELQTTQWCVYQMSAPPQVVDAPSWWAAIRQVLGRQGLSGDQQNMVYRHLPDAMILVVDVVSRLRLVVHHNVSRGPAELPVPRRLRALAALRSRELGIVERVRCSQEKRSAPVMGGVVFDASYD